MASSSNDCIIRVVSFFLLKTKDFLPVYSLYTQILIATSGFGQWRLPDGMPISVLRGHSAAVTAIAFSPRPGSAYQLLS